MIERMGHELKTFFVLNGLLNGDHGLRATWANGERMNDGWYYTITETPLEDEPEGAYRSRQMAFDAGFDRLQDFCDDLLRDYYENWEMSHENVLFPFVEHVQSLIESGIIRENL